MAAANLLYVHAFIHKRLQFFHLTGIDLNIFPSSHRIFWLGLEKIHQLTSIDKWKLKVRVKWDKIGAGDKITGADSRSGSYGESEWDDFKVGSEATNYQLGIGKQLSKDNWEGDPFHKHDLNGMAFTTKDRKNNRKSGVNCASISYGGWWHRACFEICLTCNRPKRVVYDGIENRLPSLVEMCITKV